MTRLNRTIRTAAPGITSKALRRRRGSPPAIVPMRRELTARPVQPQVMTMPIAVLVMRGKASPTTDRVVGKTGAMESPARKTRTKAGTVRLVRSMRKVVTAMATEAASRTAMADT